MADYCLCCNKMWNLACSTKVFWKLVCEVVPRCFGIQCWCCTKISWNLVFVLYYDMLEFSACIVPDILGCLEFRDIQQNYREMYSLSVFTCAVVDSFVCRSSIRGIQYIMHDQISPFKKISLLHLPNTLNIWSATILLFLLLLQL